MKKTFILIALFSILSCAAQLKAQDDLRVPLSNPGKAGVLEINAMFADEIFIKTHAEKDVQIIYNGEDTDRDSDEEKNGLRRISTGGVGLEISENNNQVSIETGPMPSDLELTVFVPENFSLNLHATQGDIYVDGLKGEIEINSVNGDVELLNISGSVVLNSVNGDILIDFIKVSPETPMSFTGVNGDIEVALPTDAKFTAKMKTEWGDIYTNYEMEIDRSSTASEIDDDHDNYRIAINKWVIGKVNGGGPEFLFKTLHGDISIRKK